MKKISFLLFALLIGALVFAQSEISWSVFHGKKKLFSSTIENEEQNILTTKISDLKSGRNFIISYRGPNTTDRKKEWKRTIGIYTTADKELYRKDSDIIKIPDPQIKKMLRENKSIKIYTWALPKDPKEAARVRVRRVHLCTIMLNQ